MRLPSLLVVVVGVIALGIAGFAQGPLTPFANLMVRANAAGALSATAVGDCGTLGPLTAVANVRVASNSQGALNICGVTGSGGIGGSTGATDNAILVADGTGGSTLKASAATADASGNTTLPDAAKFQWGSDINLTRGSGTTLNLKSSGGSTRFKLFEANGTDYTEIAGGFLQTNGFDDVFLNPAGRDVRIWNAGAIYPAVQAATVGKDGTPFGSYYTNGSINGTEISAPSSPAADKWVLYGEDDGGGKTRLCVKFSSGAAQCFATQP